MDHVARLFAASNGPQSLRLDRPREKVLRVKELQIERKRFVFVLAENHLGLYLRIVEQGDNTARHNSIVIPASGLHEWLACLTALCSGAHPQAPG